MDKEYEYSEKVKTIEPFLEYCKSNNYKLISKVKQKRVLYKNNNNILARVTTNEEGGTQKIYLDFKDSDETENLLKVSRESGKIEVTNNIDFVNASLSMLEFKLHKELYRTRYVYAKNNVKFEIDEYQKPKMKVVGVEGKKEEVDKMYEILKDKFDNLKN